MDTQTTAPQGTTGRADNVKQQSTQAASDVASTAQQEATQVAREAKDQVRELWGRTRSDLTDQAATQQTRVAGGLRELSDQLGSMAGAADQDGMARGLVEDVARRADEAARWLDQRDPGSLLEEARSFARQRPGTFLAIAAGVGVLAGRLSRSLIDESRRQWPERRLAHLLVRRHTDDVDAGQLEPGDSGDRPREVVRGLGDRRAGGHPGSPDHAAHHAAGRCRPHRHRGAADRGGRRRPVHPG